MSMPQSQKGLRTRDRILRAARRLFAAKGFSGTTTRRIARQARVNEASIFRYFPTKRDLYAAIIQKKIEEEPAFQFPPAGPGRRLDDRGLLRAIARWMFALIEHDPDFLRLLYFSALEGHALSEMFFDNYVEHLTAQLRGYIEREMDRGRYRRLDPFLAARAFLGMVAHHLLVQELFAPKFHRRFSKQRVIETFVEIFLKGMGG